MDSSKKQLSSTKKMYSPIRVACVGPTSTQSIDIALTLEPDEILVLEPDQQRIDELSRLYQQQDRLNFRPDPMLDHSEQAIYYRASASTASGFIPPADLTGIWPNVEESEQIVLDPAAEKWASTLKWNPNWIFIDRLDLSASIHRLTSLVCNADVVVFRSHGSSSRSTERLQQVEKEARAWLSEQDMIELFSFPDPRHQLQRAVWVKDWKAKHERLAKLNEALTNAAAQAERLVAELDAVRASNDAQLAELQAKYDALANSSQAQLDALNVKADTNKQEAILAQQDLVDARAQLTEALQSNEILQTNLSEINHLLEIAITEYKKEKS